MSEEPIENIIARSSLGGSGWCSNCNHPDLLHEEIGCVGISPDSQPPYLGCPCETFVPMTSNEWLRRRS